MLLIALVLAGAMAVILALRSASLTLRLSTDVLLAGALSAVFYREGQTPLLIEHIGGAPTYGVWDQALAIGWWMLVARVASSAVRFKFGHDRRSRETRLFSDLLSGGIYVGATLIVLNFVLKLPLAGLLATSGVVAIVLGLALQNTLADVFSGIAVGVEQPFRVGDRVRLGDNVEGTVYQINWRSIRVHTINDDLAIIPNSAVAKSEIVNRSFPTPRREGSVDIVCAFDIAPEILEGLVSNALLLCPEILDSGTPAAMLTRLGMRTNSFTVPFSVGDPKALARAKDALLRQIRRQLLHAGLLGEATGLPAAPGLLRRTTIFESLTDEQVDALAHQVRIVTLAAGETLFRQGEEGDSLYVVAAGVIELTRTSEDHLLIVDGRIGVGEYIGEISLLTGAPRAVTATAKTAAIVHTLDKGAIAPLLTTEPQLAAALEASVKRGRALLHRDPAARHASVVDGEGLLLTRIRSFFRI